MALPCCLALTWRLAASPRVFPHSASTSVSHVPAHMVDTRKDLGSMVKCQHLPFPFVLNFGIAGVLSLHALAS